VRGGASSLRLGEEKKGRKVMLLRKGRGEATRLSAPRIGKREKKKSMERECRGVEEDTAISFAITSESGEWKELGGKEEKGETSCLGGEREEVRVSMLGGKRCACFSGGNAQGGENFQSKKKGKTNTYLRGGRERRYRKKTESVDTKRGEKKESFMFYASMTEGGA